MKQVYPGYRGIIRTAAQKMVPSAYRLIGTKDEVEKKVKDLLQNNSFTYKNLEEARLPFLFLKFRLLTNSVYHHRGKAYTATRFSLRS